jgi:hypothetical protein
MNLPGGLAVNLARKINSCPDVITGHGCLVLGGTLCGLTRTNLAKYRDAISRQMLLRKSWYDSSDAREIA